MASNYTSNYGLCQWETADQVLREEFNEDNRKVDGTLGTLAETIAEHAISLAKCGNCKIVCGSYTGNGLAGSGNPTTLMFSDGMPLLIFIRSEEQIDSSNLHLILMRGCTWSSTYDANPQSVVWVTWEDERVQWYSPANSYAFQMNTKGFTYFYTALIPQE